MTIDQIIEEMKALLENVTGDAWEDVYPNADDGDIRVQIYHDNKRNTVHDEDAIAWRLEKVDAKFIVFARNHMPQILDELERLRKQEDDFKNMVLVYEQSCEDEEKFLKQNQILMEAVEFYAQKEKWSEEYQGGPRLNFTGVNGEGYETAQEAINKVREI